MSSMSLIRLLFTSLCSCCLLFSLVDCLDNGLGLTPQMGWNSWNTFNCDISEQLILDTMDQLVQSGLSKIGYQYVVIDDCWAEMERNVTTKRLVPDSKRFPRGIRFLSQYAHKRGLKLGIYSDVGKKTCQKRPGSHGFYELDAQTFAEWKIDYLKLDTCHLTIDEMIEPWVDYTRMSQALNQTGRPIFYSICNWGRHDTWNWAPKIANSWRTTMDIFPMWSRVVMILDSQKKLGSFSGPGAWNDPDMLEVGVNGTVFNLKDMPKVSLTPVQSKSHFSLWAIINAPLILGNDLRRMLPWVFEIISNREVIEVNQDPLGIQGTMVHSEQSGLLHGYCSSLSYCKNTEVWVKPLSDGSFAIVLFNVGPAVSSEWMYKDEQIVIDWVSHLHVSANKRFRVRDLWTHQDLGIYNGIYSSPYKIAPNDVQMLKLTPVQ